VGPAGGGLRPGARSRTAGRRGPARVGAAAVAAVAGGGLVGTGCGLWHRESVGVDGGRRSCGVRCRPVRPHAAAGASQGGPPRGTDRLGASGCRSVAVRAGILRRGGGAARALGIRGSGRNGGGLGAVAEARRISAAHRGSMVHRGRTVAIGLPGPRAASARSCQFPSCSMVVAGEYRAGSRKAAPCPPRGGPFTSSTNASTPIRQAAEQFPCASASTDLAPVA
jgi:hypothetical protein